MQTTSKVLFHSSDFVTMKGFFYWCLYFDNFDMFLLLLNNDIDNKQIYSRYDDENNSFLHLICNKIIYKYNNKPTQLKQLLIHYLLILMIRIN